MLLFQSGLPRLLSTNPVANSWPLNSLLTSLVSSSPIGLNSKYILNLRNTICNVSIVTDFFLVAAISTKAERESSPGGSQSLSKSPHCSYFSPSVGCSQNHHVGLSRLVGRRKLVTSSEDSVVKLVKTWVRQRQSFRTFATLLNSNAKRPRHNPTFLCSSALAPANFTLVGVFN